MISCIPRQRSVSARPAANSAAGITEIIVSPSPSIASNEYLDMLLPMLAHLSRQSSHRWFTWITPLNIRKSLLRDYGFSLHNMQIIRVQEDQDARWMLWEALNNGTSEMVVAETEKLCETDIREMEKASVRGDCRGFFLCPYERRF